VKRKTVVRNAALLPVLLLLAGVLVPSAHAAVLTTGVLSTGSHEVVVDSLDVFDVGGGIWRYLTAGAWGADTMAVDSFVCLPPMGFLPMMMTLWGSLDDSPFTLMVPPSVVPDTWYIIPSSPTEAQVRFAWIDTTIDAIHENGQVGPRRSGLTVSPSIVRSGTTVRAERVSGTSCAFLIFDAAGNRVRTLTTQATAGTASAAWTGEDDFGRRLPEGIYYCCLDGAANPSVRKLILSH
jgi:hypothetical protein